MRWRRAFTPQTQKCENFGGFLKRGFSPGRVEVHLRRLKFEFQLESGCLAAERSAPHGREVVPAADASDAHCADAAVRRVPHGRVSFWHQHDRRRARLHRSALHFYFV